METTNSNKRGYSLFYALLRNHPMADKDELVLTYTGGRTSHLHQMKAHEYREMCDALQRSDTSAHTVQLRKARSQALLWIGRCGIDTVDNWDGINGFCESARIAGKSFRDMTISELQSLVRKLRSIHAKGGVKRMEEREDAVQETEEAPEGVTVKIPMVINVKAIKS